MDRRSVRVFHLTNEFFILLMVGFVMICGRPSASWAQTTTEEEPANAYSINNGQLDYDRDLSNDYNGQLDHNKQDQVAPWSSAASSQGDTTAEGTSNPFRAEFIAPEQPADLGVFYPRQVVNQRLSTEKHLQHQRRQASTPRQSIVPKIGFSATVGGLGSTGP